MSTENSSDEFLPDATLDSDDSRVGTEFKNTATNRPRTRAYVSNNPDPVASLVEETVKELQNFSRTSELPERNRNTHTHITHAHSDKARVAPVVAPRETRRTGVNTAANDIAVYDVDTIVTAVNTFGTTTVATNNIHNATNQGRAATTDTHINNNINPYTNTAHVNDAAHTQSFVNKNKAISNYHTINMSLSLGEALNLIPSFDGTVPTDIYPFINACDIALESISIERRPALLKMITTKLRGNAYAVTQHRNVNEWDSLKTLLEEEFCAQRTATHLQLELNSTRQQEGETVNNYSSRVQTLFHELCNASAMGKTEGEAKIIRNHIKSQTLAIYVEGLRQPVKTIIKAGKPQTLEMAIKESLEEERVYKSDKESQRFFGNPKPGGRSKYCSRCKTNTHQTENCRFIKGIQTYRSPQNNTLNFKRETTPTFSGDRKKKYCVYCKKGGHEVNECRNKKRNSSQGTSGNSGNENRPSVKSERTVRDLQLTATTSASTSSQ